MAQKGAAATEPRTAVLGFDARVEPLWLGYAERRAELGFFERWRERRRLGRIARAAGRAAGSAEGWDRTAGACVCNLRVARMGLVKELKNHVRESGDWPHLQALRDRPCYLVPLDFARPLNVDPGGGGEPLPVASAVRVKAELAALNERFRIDETFAIKKMVDFLDATERDIEVYERKLGTSEGFWAKFAYVLLKKLADTSAEKGLPAILK
jgi:hypothetical protein